ncbi:MAG: sulfotransferase domain-containing protein [Parafilimonas sp.]|nr:sulfotransferase domain-containing protein [Parafilimonas sp.]
MEPKIDLVIAGAQKAGTTSLNKYLAQHPNIYTHFTQEFGMFASNEDFDKGLQKNIRENVEKQLLIQPGKNVFIAKRVGVMYNKEMMQKIYQSYSDCKMVVILRNPVDRAFSAFNYCRMAGMEPYKKFEDALYINDPARFTNPNFKRNCDYIYRSNYLAPLQNMQLIFPAENIKVYIFEEIVKNLKAPLNEMVDSLNLPPFEFDTKKNYNEGSASRFDTVSKLTAPGNFNILKKVFTVQQRVKMKEYLKKLNSKKNASAKETLSENTRKYLVGIFRQEVQELEQFLKLPVKRYWPEFFTTS